MNIFLKIWYAFVGEPTHLKAVKALNKALHKLEEAKVFQEAKAEAMEIAAKAAAEAAKVAEEAAQKASRVREKLGELLEID